MHGGADSSNPRSPASSARRSGPLAAVLALAVLVLPVLAGGAGAQEIGVTAIPSSYLPGGITCDRYNGFPGGNGLALYGVQCTATTSFGGGGEADEQPDPIPLQPGVDSGPALINGINTWLSERGVDAAITNSSLVGIEAFGGKGRNGDSCGACSSGKGGNGGYATTVATLGGMQNRIANSGFTDDGSPVPPVLYVFVGDRGQAPSSHHGGGGGSATWVTGVQPNLLSTADVQSPDDAIVFAIGGGGGGGGGVDGSSGSGKHGGHGGSMIATGPNEVADTTVAGEDGSGGSGEGQGGSASADGAGGTGGDDNDGTSGIGGLGGYDSSTAGFVGTGFSWDAGQGGRTGGGRNTGGGGGGGWGGGGGAGQNENSTGNIRGRGGGGGGSWAHKTVSSDYGTLPTQVNVYGNAFSVTDSELSTAVLTFSLVGPDAPAGAPTSTRDCMQGGWAEFPHNFPNQGQCVRHLRPRPR